MKRMVVMISGGGSNLQALIDAVQSGRLPVQILAVVSNRKSAYGLTRAQNASIPTLYFPLKPYTDKGFDREEYDADLAYRVGEYHPDLIVLAGWMHVLSANFLNYLAGIPVINLHPALPGMFAGTHAIQRAYEAWQRGEIDHSGCMVHEVVPEVDAGPVVAQAVVPFLPGDTLEAYEARMHEAEHQLIVEATAFMLSRLAAR
ncbi:MAG: phosphoribosylglycinamide formyltransferase [bacterium]|nr:phosphoribosylglycinamide formyltransferase [bacterium]